MLRKHSGAKSGSDAVAIITGGGSGIGQGLANGLASRGVDVVIIDKKEISSVREHITPRDGADIIYYCADITNFVELCKIAEDVEKRFGSIDILINNAAIFPSGGILESDISEWTETIDINLSGSFFATKAFLPTLMKSEGASIIMISSPWARANNPSGARVAYSASKAGLAGLAKSLAFELAPHRIRVNTIIPGTIATDMLVEGTRRFIPNISKKDVFQFIGAYQPLGRIGTPNDILEAVCFFASPGSNWITGTELVVDGGGLLKFDLTPRSDTMRIE